MSRLVRLLASPLTPDPSDILHRWGNGVVVPLLWMAVGLPYVWRTAATPFEEFQGTLTVIGFSLLWTVWADVVRRQKPTGCNS